MAYSVTQVLNRVTDYANSVLQVAVKAGTAIIGKVGIDQTTPGTTNAVTLKGKKADNSFEDLKSDDAGALKTSATITGSLAALAGEKVVAAAATPEALAASTACRSVTIQAKTDNVDSVFIGNAAGQYIELEPGASVPLDAANLNLVYVKVLQNGDGVNYLGVA